jgi:RNA polymerase sporulation-specific sigma factor
MFLTILTTLIKSMFCFTGSYSNNIFPDPLSKEEEEKYIKLHLNGDKDARNKLIEHNLRLVAHIVKKYESSRNDTDDLISIGIIGLIKGIDTYSYKHGTKLTTYCARCIDNEILMYFRSDKKNSKNISIDEKVGFDKDGNEITFMDILKTPKPDFAEDIHIKNNIELLSKYINILSDREKTIIYKRYGINGYDELTQKEIAKELGISRSYVSRIEKRALTKLLREFIRNNRIF